MELRKLLALELFHQSGPTISTFEVRALASIFLPLLQQVKQTQARTWETGKQGRQGRQGDKEDKGKKREESELMWRFI